ncbi:hypothetical protein A0U92_08680 [Acetobacter aceti]|uniref:Uncharacterized protein n=1 Tax=Acetobacter aceti TaxID=435 RepID=A0A1U9KGA6_ACEAC|nr:hypothetical protein A0U92_08680 [Acetobacter aceti]
MNVFSKNIAYSLICLVLIYVSFYSFYVLMDLKKIECLIKITHLKKYKYIMVDGSVYFIFYFLEFLMYSLVILWLFFGYSLVILWLFFGYSLVFKI